MLWWSLAADLHMLVNNALTRPFPQIMLTYFLDAPYVVSIVLSKPPDVPMATRSRASNAPLKTERWKTNENS